MTRIVVRSEALAAAALTEYALRSGHRRVLPNVWVAAGSGLSLAERIEAAWLWSGRRAVIAGLPAAALLGSSWVDDTVPIELIWENNRAPAGVVTRRGAVLPGETQQIAGMLVTTPARTGFDLGRRAPLGRAVAHLDALVRATRLDPADIPALAQRHPHVRGLRQLPRAVDLIDAGAQSPRETWLRLLLIDAGYPRPRTQIPIPRPDGRVRYYLDMGWEDVMVAAEYDGEQHRLDPRQYHRDLERSEHLANLGWTVIRVVAGDHASAILARVADAFARRRRLR